MINNMFIGAICENVSLFWLKFLKINWQNFHAICIYTTKIDETFAKVKIDWHDPDGSLGFRFVSSEVTRELSWGVWSLEI